MSKIYGIASETIMWLGKSDASSSLAMQYLNECSTNHSMAFKDMEVETRDALDMLFSRPVWTRVWIIQEVVVAKTLSVISGPDCSKFDRWPMIERPTDRQHRRPQASRIPHPTSTDEIWGRVSALQNLRSQYRTSSGMSLELGNLLYLSRKHDCSDRRDKIYALLSLLSPKERANPLLQSDYSLSFPEFVQRISVYLLSHHQSLHLLRNTVVTNRRHESTYSHFQLPSWILDFENIRSPFQEDISLFQAGGSRTLDNYPLKFTDDLKTLIVWGAAVGHISILSISKYVEIDGPWNKRDELPMEFKCQDNIGYATQLAEEGDLLVVLFGANVPFLLRLGQDNTYKLIGEW